MLTVHRKVPPAGLLVTVRLGLLGPDLARVPPCTATRLIPVATAPALHSAQGSPLPPAAFVGLAPLPPAHACCYPQQLAAPKRAPHGKQASCLWYSSTGCPRAAPEGIDTSRRAASSTPSPLLTTLTLPRRAKPRKKRTSDPATRKARRSWGRPFLEEDPFINGDPLNESDSELDSDDDGGYGEETDGNPVPSTPRQPSWLTAARPPCSSKCCEGGGSAGGEHGAKRQHQSGELGEASSDEAKAEAASPPSDSPPNHRLSPVGEPRRRVMPSLREPSICLVRAVLRVLLRELQRLGGPPAARPLEARPDVGDCRAARRRAR